jgi:hypothetical protein
MTSCDDLPYVGADATLRESIELRPLVFPTPRDSQYGSR